MVDMIPDGYITLQEARRWAFENLRGNTDGKLLGFLTLGPLKAFKLDGKELWTMKDDYWDSVGKKHFEGAFHEIPNDLLILEQDLKKVIPGTHEAVAPESDENKELPISTAATTPKVRQNPAKAPSEGNSARPVGSPRTKKGEMILEEMRKMNPNELNGLKQVEMASRFGASESTCRGYRNKVIKEKGDN